MFVRLRAIARRLSRAREWFPLTNLGLIVVGLAALAYWGFGVPRSDYVVQLVSALAMALVVTALFAVLVGSVLVFRATREGSVESLSFEAHRGFAEAFTLPTWWFLPLFDVQWTWLEPEGFRVEVLRRFNRRVERIETERRGHVDRIVRRLVIEDAFGLARFVLHRAENRSVTVVPWSGALDRAPMVRSLAAGDALPHPRGALVGDPVDMRRYVPGDPLKLAMWKVYARTRELMVRTPERAIAPSTQVAAYLPAAEADEPPAAAARMAVEQGLLGPDWMFGADGAVAPTQDLEVARRQIVDARRHRRSPTGQGVGLSAFVEGGRQPDATRLIVFVPGRPGPWLENVAAVARSRPDRTTFVVVIDGLQSGDPAARRWQGWLKRPSGPKDEDEAVVAADELERVIGALAGTGAEVTALDRVRGRALNVGVPGRSAPGRGTRQVA